MITEPRGEKANRKEEGPGYITPPDWKTKVVMSCATESVLGESYWGLAN